MKIAELDRAMNNLFEKYEFDEATELERTFLENVAQDLVELLIEKGRAQKIVKLVIGT